MIENGLGLRHESSTPTFFQIWISSVRKEAIEFFFILTVSHYSYGMAGALFYAHYAHYSMSTILEHYSMRHYVY